MMSELSLLMVSCNRVSIFKKNSPDCINLDALSMNFWMSWDQTLVSSASRIKGNGLALPNPTMNCRATKRSSLRDLGSISKTNSDHCDISLILTMNGAAF